MNSSLPKVLHPVCGLPMVEHIGRAMRAVGIQKPIVVYGPGGEKIPQTLGSDYAYAFQAEQLGTADAVSAALPMLDGHEGPVLVAPGDAPLITQETFSSLIGIQAAEKSSIVIAVCEVADPTGYGRIVRNEHWEPVRIVEDVDSSKDEKNIKEINGAFYCFSIGALRTFLPQIQPGAIKNEFYLTDIVDLLAKAGERVSTLSLNDPSVLSGVNDRWQLAEVSSKMRERILKNLALSGVTIVDVASTYVEVDVRVGRDTVILPGTCLHAGTVIGEECEIGPGSRICASDIGNRTSVLMSQVNGARIGNDCRVGPFANIRPNTVIGNEVKVGNYVEIKAANIGDRVSLAHLSYVGDASVGAGSNIGAGTITCNFDGYCKHRTEIGENVFIGSNSTLVAPLDIGSGAFIAAGSVITEDVEASALGVGRSRQTNKPGWAKRWRELKSNNRE